MRYLHEGLMENSVTFVVTEHRTYLDRERVARYEEIRRLLEALSGWRADSVHYLEVGLLGSGPVVLSGSSAPWARHDPADLERLGDTVLAADAPVFGICGGFQLLASFAGGKIEPLAAAGRPREEGYLPLEVLDDRDLLAGLPPQATVFQDHRDEITELPEGFRVLARTPVCAVQAVAVPERRWWGTQFHPERFDDRHPDGGRVIENFFALAA
jgi:GMP synthase (glutamine-hydrolysing)